ncbi:probable serine/threonine-protein kinase PIX13 [Cucurbita maxima]|uniref:non-specific serine/threonine protein kinase n=1 Tax=Cucurbita maxima TaxID=3661 RepID=A0A6J1KDX8_CUCMA|nr:probable serine/threonine-protein kinase PIX13 [Cucurbita maxima]
MGNLCGTPVDAHSLPPTKPSSPGHLTSIPRASSTPLDLKVYTLSELKTATKNFRPDTLLGEGGFGRVFKGWVDRNTYAPSKVGVGIPVAVKKSNPDSSQGLREWKAEVEFLGKFTHPNVVKLIGYCWEDKHFLLIYEYMERGSLENHIFRKGVEPPSWETRIKIAVGAARGLKFLHTSEKSVIYRDLKAANILLDWDFNPKLSDFGLAKLGPSNGYSHVSTDPVGTCGYTAPEYIASGHLYIKSDVFGFGVVLLELLTGMRAVDPNRPSKSHNLVKWAKPSLSNKKKMTKLMDPRLGDDYSPGGAWGTSELILKCLKMDPRDRPSMEEVLVTLEEISTFTDRPNKKPKSKARKPISH